MNVEKKSRQMADEENEDVAHHDGREITLHRCFAVVAAADVVVVVVCAVAHVAVAVGESSLGKSQRCFAGSTDDSCGN